jgi:TMEM175 potassium channel family protein
VNATYICLIWELVDALSAHGIAPTVRRAMWIRSIATLCLFGIAALVALKYPLAGLIICICCLIVYLKPDPPSARTQQT